MSRTEIYGFGKDGNIISQNEARNSFLGAMFIWTTLEKKYLPSLPIPHWKKFDNFDGIEKEYYSRASTLKPENMKEIWSLIDDPRLSRIEKIVLSSTFDHALIKRENFEEFIEALTSFDKPKDSNLRTQAEIVKQFLDNEEIIALGYNQTSVNSNPWWVYGNEEDEDGRSYNCLTDTKHYWLWDEL